MTFTANTRLFEGDYRMWFTAESYKLFVEWSQASIALQNKMRQHHAQTSE